MSLTAKPSHASFTRGPTLFHSEALNALIEEALKNSPTLRAAKAALRRA
jgi:outer membrane protein TolC